MLTPSRASTHTSYAYKCPGQGFFSLLHYPLQSHTRRSQHFHGHAPRAAPINPHLSAGYIDVIGARFPIHQEPLGCIERERGREREVSSACALGPKGEAALALALLSSGNWAFNEAWWLPEVPENGGSYCAFLCRTCFDELCGWGRGEGGREFDTPFSERYKVICGQAGWFFKVMRLLT